MFPQSFDFVCSDPRRMGQRHGEMLRYAARDDTVGHECPTIRQMRFSHRLRSQRGPNPAQRLLSKIPRTDVLHDVNESRRQSV